MFAVRVAIADAGDGAVTLEQIDDLRVPDQRERREPRRFARDEFQEVPLRNERDIRKPGRKPLESEGDRLAGRRPAADVRDFAVWKGEKRVRKTELVENLEHRRVNRIPAKIAQEITVLLEHDDADAGAGER